MDEIEPAATTSTTCGGAELCACLLEVGANVLLLVVLQGRSYIELLGGEGSHAYTGGVRFYHADGFLDSLRRNAEAGEDASDGC